MKNINWRDIDETLALGLMIVMLFLCAGGMGWVLYSFFVKNTTLESVQLILFVTSGIGLYYIFEVGCKRLQKRSGRDLNCSKNATGAFSLFIFVVAMLVLVLR